MALTAQHLVYRRYIYGNNEQHKKHKNYTSIFLPILPVDLPVKKKF